MKKDKKSKNNFGHAEKIMFFVVLGSLVTIIGLFYVFMDGLAGMQNIILNN